MNSGKLSLRDLLVFFLRDLLRLFVASLFSFLICVISVIWGQSLIVQGHPFSPPARRSAS